MRLAYKSTNRHCAVVRTRTAQKPRAGVASGGRELDDDEIAADAHNQRGVVLHKLHECVIIYVSDRLSSYVMSRTTSAASCSTSCTSASSYVTLTLTVSFACALSTTQRKARTNRSKERCQRSFVIIHHSASCSSTGCCTSASSHVSDRHRLSSYVIIHSTTSCSATGCCTTRYRRALSDFERVVALAPKHAVGWNFVGLCAAQLGDVKRAQAGYARATALDPRFKEAWANGAQLARDAGDAARALALFDAALRIDPAYLHARYLRGLCAYAAGDLKRSSLQLHRSGEETSSLCAASFLGTRRAISSSRSRLRAPRPRRTPRARSSR